MSARQRPPLGQHFLNDRNILAQIVDALDPARDDVVVEIGAGKGSLTSIVAPRVGTVIALETDRRLAHECRLRIADCGFRNATVVEGDALELNWHTLLEHEQANPQSAIRNPQFKILGNIPYAITSPLIDKALTPPLPERIVFLVQAEVADRLAARPGSKAYGALSVGVQAVCRVERLFTVRAGAFTPPPRVASAVVRLTPRVPALVGDAAVLPLRRFVAACFSRRRKQLRNVLVSATGRSPVEVMAALGALDVDPTARPETLAPEIFVRLLRWASRL